jgi:hypothetical protein
MKARDIYFVRPNADLSKVKLTSKGAEEIMIIDGQKCAVFGNAKWTGIRPIKAVNEPKTAKTARQSRK